MRLAGTRTALPARFEVQVLLDDPECGVLLEVSIDTDTNTPVVDAMTVVRTGDRQRFGPPITGAMTRRIAVDTLLRRGVDQLAEPIVAVRRDGMVGVFQLQRDADAGESIAYGGRPAQAPSRRQAPRQAITDDFLQRVASVYRSADRAPTQAVADQLHVSRSHAGRLVAQARAAGHLGTTTRGKAGEQR
ncbi:hypothetical protein [Pseudonocardia adelaidensis]|uniref:hypothetical protein n=1 Tax=Pseudonocardia adelaidensis TaxID=648754 RepID=UPI0031E6B276